MGCVNSVPSTVHSGDGKSLRAPVTTADRERPHVEKTTRTGGDMDTTASGKQSDWQMPSIWDLKTGRNPSIQNDNSSSLGLHNSPSIKSGTGSRTASRLQRSHSEQSVSLSRRRTGRNLILTESPELDETRNRSTRYAFNPMSRSKSFASNSPAGSGLGTPVMQSPGSTDSSYQTPLKQVILTRKRAYVASNNRLESRLSLRSHSASTFTDISKARFS